MRFVLLLSFRYLFGKKSTNAINLITSISIIGIAIGTAALVLILSVFNGFESLMKEYLDDFNPDIKIEAVSGKFFAMNSLPVETISVLPGVEGVSYSIEEVALLEYNQKQQVGIVKGVDTRFLQVNSLSNAIKEGEARLTDDGTFFAILGRGVARNLNVSIENRFTPLHIYVPNRRKRGVLDKDFTSRSLSVSGVFSIQNERDNQYVICPYEFIAPILDLEGEASSLEISVDPSVSVAQVVAGLEPIIGSDFKALDRFKQDESFLRIMNIEKWSSYLIFAFTLVLIIFNVIGCLWMIVLDKKKDISILQAMGTTKKRIRQIFVCEGILISLCGFLAGFIAAVVFYILQKTIGIITVPAGFSITSYPIEMESMDVLVVFITVLVLGVLASLPAARRASRISAFVHVE